SAPSLASRARQTPVSLPVRSLENGMAVTTEVRRLAEHVGQDVTLRGWIETTRSHGRVGFAVLRDGSGIVQAVFSEREVPPETWAAFQALTQETSVHITGVVRAEPRAPGGYEIGARDLVIVGTSEDYPIQPKEHGIDFLLDHRHLWLRSSQQRAILRVRAEVEQAIHDFY